MSPEILEIKNNETTNIITQEGKKFDEKARAIVLSALIALSGISPHNASAEKRGHPLVTPHNWGSIRVAIEYFRKPEHKNEWNKVQKEFGGRMKYPISTPEDLLQLFERVPCRDVIGDGKIELHNYDREGNPIGTIVRECYTDAEGLLMDKKTGEIVGSERCYNSVPGIVYKLPKAEENVTFTMENGGYISSDCDCD